MSDVNTKISIYCKSGPFMLEFKVIKTNLCHKHTNQVKLKEPESTAFCLGHLLPMGKECFCEE